jgi:mannitol-1-phosphate 5-dehydrogenase
MRQFPPPQRRQRGFAPSGHEEASGDRPTANIGDSEERSVGDGDLAFRVRKSHKVSAPRCVVIGTGRVAGGFLAPLLRAAGWEPILVGRNRAVVKAINEGSGLWLNVARDPSGSRWIGGVRAVSSDDPSLPGFVAEADLVATAVGPSSLPDVGRLLAPLLRARLQTSSDPVNVIAFENHKRAPEILTLGLLEGHASLAAHIGRRIGVGGAAVWRAVSNREVTPSGVRYDANGVDECYVDVASLVTGAPLDGSIPGLALVRPFEDRIVEKLWVYNAGHAAAAYLGWHAGCETLDEAMAHEEIRATVSSVVREVRTAFEAHLSARPGSVPIPSRRLGSILDLYADPALDDSVVRVARDPRRKLAADDRLIGPASACLAAGMRPHALARVIAAALAYGEESDHQARDLRRELGFLEPEEVLSEVSTLDRNDELTRLVCQCYHAHISGEVAL